MKNKIKLIKSIIGEIEQEIILTERFNSTADSFCPESVYFNLLRYIIETDMEIPDQVSSLIVFVNSNNMVTACEIQCAEDTNGVEICWRFDE